MLLDEQMVVYEKVLSFARSGIREGANRWWSYGRAGTGKSVIALNLMGTLLLDGINAQYATGSKAFTEAPPPG